MTSIVYHLLFWKNRHLLSKSIPVVAIIDDSQLQEVVSIGRSRTDQRPTSADSVEIIKEGDAKLDIELITIFTCYPIYFGNVSVI